MFSSVAQLDNALKASGYIADPVTVNTVYLAAALHRPLLLEGVAGGGKTQLAYAVAEAAETTVERLQCYQGIDESKAIGKFDESLQRLCVELWSKRSDLDWELLAKELHMRRFFSAGPLLKSLECEKPCVLLVDELDKVDHAFEAQAFKRSCAAFGLGRYSQASSLVQQCLKLHRWGDGQDERWPSRLRERVPEMEDYLENTDYPGPGVLIVFDENDAIEACCSEELQYLGQNYQIGSTLMLLIDLEQDSTSLDKEVQAAFEYLGRMLRSLAAATEMIETIRGIYDADLRRGRLDARVQTEQGAAGIREEQL